MNCRHRVFQYDSECWKDPLASQLSELGNHYATLVPEFPLLWLEVIYSGRNERDSLVLQTCDFAGFYPPMSASAKFGLDPR